MSVVFDEAEAAGGLLEAIQAHDEALDLTTLGEELVDLLLGGVEGEVADVEGGGVGELVFDVWGRGASGVFVGGAALAFLVLGVQVLVEVGFGVVVWEAVYLADCVG